MKKLFASAILCAATLVWSAQYQVATFFDGTPVTAVSGVTLLSSNVFLGYIPGGDESAGGTLADVTAVLQSNGWTKQVLVPAATAGFSFGFRAGYGTNMITVTGAGSNGSNGEYAFDFAKGNRYTNDLGHSISNNLGTTAYWILRNAEGGTNYRKTVTSGLNSGNWVVVLPGIAPVPTSTFTDTNANGMTILTLAASYDKSNWLSLINLTNSSENIYWRGTNVPVTLTDFNWLTVVGATNFNTNGAAITNAYLRAYYR